MGEAEFEQKTPVVAVEGAIVESAKQSAEQRIATPGGKFQVR